MSKKILREDERSLLKSPKLPAINSLSQSHFRSFQHLVLSDPFQLPRPWPTQACNGPDRQPLSLPPSDKPLDTRELALDEEFGDAAFCKMSTRNVRICEANLNENRIL